jgi:DNA mismatch repair protein MutS
MMQQYMDIKNEYKDALLFFRLGDFYEMFFDDAIIASRELEIALTARDCGLEEKAPMCGVPHHVAETYISRLVDRGYKVAVCEQTEDPALAKGLVKRAVTRIVTPGTIIDSSALDEKTNNFLASVYFDDYGAGIAYVDNSTGEMFTTEYIGDVENTKMFLLDELGKIMPSELVINKSAEASKHLLSSIELKINPFINITDDSSESVDRSLKEIYGFFRENLMTRELLKSKIYSALSSARLIRYLKATQFDQLDHIMDLQYYEPQNYMLMDINTRTNLEIHETLRSREKRGALISILDRTKTAMGGRLLKKWLEQPLLDKAQLNIRLDMVEFFVDNPMTLDDMNRILKNIYDIERLSSKISTGNCSARDMASLRQSVSKLPELKELLISTQLDHFIRLENELDPLEDVFERLENSLIENPPLSIKEGGFIKDGYNAQLDSFREGSRMGMEWLAKLEQNEKQRTGIKTLKVGYNRVMGYYIDITKTNLDNVPDDYIRKQTLANSERYYTEELKTLEDKITGASERAVQLEYELFQELRSFIKDQLNRLQKTSRLLAILDVIGGLATVSSENGFTRPALNNSGTISIKNGRHPVVEATIEHHLFVPNDTEMDNRDNMLHIITGPNMAGKSTYMRQIAIIVLLAQIGSFVPAEEADISIVDRIFTRIGASDNLSQGESTFMVEMNEVSNILRFATKKSLVILDEVGRGTSTYDGLSIAWAVIEYIAEHIRAKTLFATHYHELTQLESKEKGIVNYNILAEERGEDVVFLRKVVRGSTSQSFGIQVAKLAGIKKEIIVRANEILTMIEGSHTLNLNKPMLEPNQKQMDLMDYKKDYFIDRVKNIDIDNMTPIDALNTLNGIVKDARNLRE